MNGVVEVVLVVALVGYVLVRRFRGEPAEGKRLVLLPGILAVVGFTSVAKVAQSGLSITFLLVSIVVSVLIGLLRGASVRVYESDGIVHMRYTLVSIGLLVVNLAVRFGSGLVLGAIDSSAARAANSGLMLAIGASLLAEGLVVLSKAMRTDGQLVWSTRVRR